MKPESRAIVATMAGVILGDHIIREVVDLHTRKVWPVRGWNDRGHFCFVNDKNHQRIEGNIESLYDAGTGTYVHFMPDDGGFHGRVHGESCDFAGEINGTRVSLYDYEDKRWRYFELRIAHAQVA